MLHCDVDAKIDELQSQECESCSIHIKQKRDASQAARTQLWVSHYRQGTKMNQTIDVFNNESWKSGILTEHCSEEAKSPHAVLFIGDWLVVMKQS